MTGMDGASWWKSCAPAPATMNIAVILLATKADLAMRLNLERQVDEFIEKLSTCARPAAHQARHRQNPLEKMAARPRGGRPARNLRK